MPEVVRIEEFAKEGFAIVEDTVGKFVITKHSPEMVPLEDKKNTTVDFIPDRKLCALVQSRDRMML